MRQMDSISRLYYSGRNGHIYGVFDPTAEDIRKMLDKCSSKRRNLYYITDNGVRGVFHRNDNGVGVLPSNYCVMKFLIGRGIVDDDCIPRLLVTYGRASDGRMIIRAHRDSVGYVEVGGWC